MIALLSFLQPLVAKLQGLLPIPVIEGILNLFVPTLIDRGGRHVGSSLHPLALCPSSHLRRRGCTNLP